MSKGKYVRIMNRYGYLMSLLYFVIVQIMARHQGFLEFIGGLDNFMWPAGILTIIYATLLLKWGNSKIYTD